MIRIGCWFYLVQQVLHGSLLGMETDAHSFAPPAPRKLPTGLVGEYYEAQICYHLLQVPYATWSAGLFFKKTLFLFRYFRAKIQPRVLSCINSITYLSAMKAIRK